MTVTSVLLSQHAFKHNLNVIRKIAGNKKIIFPVKANAYGHGLREMVEMSKNLVDFYMVASLDEALFIQSLKPSAPIFIDIPLITKEEVEEAVKNGFRINLATVSQFKLIEDLPSELQGRMVIHVEIDTGMNRTGFKVYDIPKLNEFLLQKRGITVEGVFTHFATGREKEGVVKEQYALFQRILKMIKFPYKYVHAENSAALLTVNFKEMDFVRPGITLYGLKPASLYNEVHLERVLSLKSRVVDVKRIKKGEGVSYGYTYIAEKDTTIATIPVGYGDGYPRHLSNKGYVLIRGKKVKIIGTICMNHFMVDAGEIKDLSVGEEVVLIGRQGENEITADELAHLAGTINYEIVTRVSPFLPRFIIK